MSTKTNGTTPNVPEKAPAVQETKPGLADRVDSAVDSAQSKLDAVVDARPGRVAVFQHKVLDATQTQVDKGFDKAKDALQK